MASHVYRIAFRSQLASLVEIVNTFHIENETDVGAQSSLDTFVAHNKANYEALLPTTAMLIDATASEVPLDSTPIPNPDQGFDSINEAGTRSVADTDLSSGLTAVAQLKTGVGGRRARGRVWLPPPLNQGETQTGGTWLTTSGHWFDHCNTFLTALIGSYTNGVQLVVYSKVAAAQDAANVWFHVLGYSLQNTQHFLRSRKPPGP